MTTAADRAATVRTDGYRYPFPPYPSGWYAVTDADDVATGSVVPRRAFGRDLVVYRTGSEVRAAEAICPHLGAHLGHGGVVDGECLRCPFHGWAFDESGQCVDVPYAELVPEKARLLTLPVIEWAGLVIVYHGPPGRPTWRPDLPSLDDGWTFVGRRRWTVRVHVQDVAENGFDVAHIGVVHDSPIPQLTRADAVGQTFFIETTPQPDCPSRAYLTGIDRTLWGVGLSMNEFRGAVEGRVVLTRTPVDEQYSEITLGFWPRTLASADETEAVGALLMDRVSSELEQDIPIWEHKAYLERPLLATGDGPIGVFRRWCRQFHSDS